MKEKLLVLMFTIGLSSFGICTKAQDYTFETSDITRFWETYDTIATMTDSAEISRVFNEMYLEKASDGFKELMKTCGDVRTPEYFIEDFQLYPNFWKSCRNSTLKIRDKQNEIDSVFNNFNALFPEFTPPKVCVLIGTFSIGGNATDEWILLGGEYVSYDSCFELGEFVTDDKKSWEHFIMSNYLYFKNAKISLVIAHETTHFLQENQPSDNVLVHCIYEGVAEFISEKMSGEKIKTAYSLYGEEHEEELLAEFIEDKNNKDISGWLYEGSQSDNRPKDVGYFVGYKICEAYYLNQKDSVKAIKDMIAISDNNDFFEKSGYAQKFKTKGLLTRKN